MSLWVLVTNSSFAEIFSVNKNGKEIKKEHHIDFPKGREKGRDILSDRPGRSFDSFGNNRHALSKEMDLHSQEQQVFSRQLSEILKKGKENHQFDQLAILAPPEFLGVLRAVLPEEVKQAIVKEINKDIPEYMSDHERIDTFCKYLEIQRPAYIPKR